MSATVDLGARRDTLDSLYRAVRAIARFWLWIFFKSVDVRHPEQGFTSLEAYIGYYELADEAVCQWESVRRRTRQMHR